MNKKIKVLATQSRWLCAIALVTTIALSMTVMGCSNDPGGDGDDGKHWLIHSQTTYIVQDGIVKQGTSILSGVYGDVVASSTNYTWSAYRYGNKTDYEEEYTTFSDTTTTLSSPVYSNGVSLTSESYSEYHNTRNGQTSHSTTETISLAHERTINIDIGIDRYRITGTSATASSTTATYDSESGLTTSATTVSSSGTTITYYTIELIIDLDGVQTYKHTPIGSNGYSIIKIQDGRTLETSYYNEQSGLISTTTYIQPDNAEISSKLPNFTLYSTRYFLSASSIINSYQTAEVLPWEYTGPVLGFYWNNDWDGLTIRVKTFNDGVLSSQTDYTYAKRNPNVSLNPVGIEYEENGSYVNRSDFELKRWGDYWYGENGKIYLWTGTGSNVVIPEQINGKPVTGIEGVYGPSASGIGAFQNRYKLTSVTIPNSVTSIGGAFTNCYSLTSVTFQGTIPADGFSDYAFNGDLREKYREGGPGTYTKGESSKWTKQGGNGGGNPSDGTGWTTVTDSNIGTWTFYAIAFGNGKFVAGVYGDKISTSTDGVTWTAAANIGISTKAIAYGGGKFVAGAHGGAMSYSSDGVTWQAITNVPFGTSADIMAIAYGNGKFVVGGTIGSNTVYSSDGVTWQAVANSILGTASLGGSAAVSAIAYGNNLFVAAGNGKAATSTDGVTWTAATSIDNSSEAIAYGDGKFVIVGMYGKMVYSADGATWTAVTDSTFGTSNIHTIAYGGGKFVAGGNDGKMATSPDGVTWTAITDNPFLVADPTYSSVQTIAYGNGKFVVGGTTNLTDVNLSGKMACLSDN